MKRILPLLLALLLLAACGTAPVAEPEETHTTALPLESEPGEPDAPSSPAEGPDEDELPILTDDGLAAAPVEDEGEPSAPALPSRAVTVTLDGLSSFLRVTLPENWTWEQAGGTADGTVYALYPEDDPEFKVELHWWSDGFGMCGTGVTFADYTLPDGRTATLATEEIGEEIWWTLILPESPDSFTIQFGAKKSVYEAHLTELELLLGSIHTGVLAGLDVVTPETSMG